MKKQIWLSLIGISVVALSACGNTKLKKALGTNMVWADEVGYFSSAASVFEEDGTRYYIYETNKQKKSEDVSFALRTSKQGKKGEEFSKAKIILEASPDSWDKRIFSPSIVKGEFHKGDKTYNYLLAYGARKGEKDIANQVGIAYAESLDGKWIKHGKPIITYDAEESGDEYGAGAPSLVSYDKKGKVRMFYSYAETNLANERIVDCDFSDLDNIKMDKGIRQISVNGLRDNADVTILSNADFALDNNGKLYCTRDVYPLSGNIPGHSTSIQTAVADVKILNDFVNYEWDIKSTLNTSMTVDIEDDDSMGWDEIYSPAIVTDPYGYLPENSKKLTIIYSTAVEPENKEDTSYKWAPCLAYYEVNI